MISAVFLDVDDTLVDYAPAARAAFATALGPDASYEQWLALDHFERWVAGEFTGFEQFRNRRMADFLAMLGRDADADLAASIERSRFEGLAEHYALFDDVLPLLEVLRSRNLAIGLITNNESVHQRDKIARVGLDGLVDAIVISDEVGVAKPSPLIFEHACRMLGVDAAAAVHVGDNLLADARGARAAGLRGFWLDRHGALSPPDTIDDVTVIRGLHELPAHLGVD